ncbi:hypothetical protein [Umezawaea sp. Da 62-37]|nr:hypothetical protein [Umezawaea sp. Da 62-37]WNV85765.1 hypothetical protein RM788_47915 [Umezawaea sp. Da 62-37]
MDGITLISRTVLRERQGRDRGDDRPEAAARFHEAAHEWLRGG